MKNSAGLGITLQGIQGILIAVTLIYCLYGNIKIKCNQFHFRDKVPRHFHSKIEYVFKEISLARKYFVLTLMDQAKPECTG